MSSAMIPRSFNKNMVAETTLLINASNPTVVGTWSLGLPIKEEISIRTRLTQSVEALGPNGDRRVRVPKTELLPGGKYRAICKLFLAYVNGGPKEEYIGTGWLISEDTIVTAGHCTYDHQGGSYLKYVKIYFGYDGPSSVTEGTCVYRHGVTVAAPAEYLKAMSFTHDVGFIQLDSPIKDITPIKYADTPLKATQDLGIVGFPSNRDYGFFLYEDWGSVDIDLTQSGALLNYNVDTTGGQSGSPVFCRSLDAIGVHVAGGWPNVGSAIGLIGNKFEEYLLAIKVKNGYTTSSAKTLNPGLSFSLVPGFQMISITPSTQNKASFGNNSDTDATLKDALAKQERALQALFPKSRSPAVNGGGNNKAPQGEVARGIFLEFPEALQLDLEESAPAGEESPPDYDAAVTRAKENPDIDTVFFVNFLPGGLDDKVREMLVGLQDQVGSWQSWSSTMCEGKVQEKINNKSLPADNSAESMSKRSTYRAKVFDYLMRESPWFARTFDQHVSKKIEVKTVEFHAAILETVLEGLTIPTAIFGQLENVIRSITNGVLKAGQNKTTESMQYWIMLTRYNYQPITRTVHPTIRIISFQVNQKTMEYTFDKSKYSSVCFDLSFGQAIFDFNSKVYSLIQEGQFQELVAKGLALTKNKSWNVEV